MDDIQITRGGERKQLLLFSSMVLGVVVLVLPRQYALPKGFGNEEEYLNSDPVPPDIGTADDTGIRKL